MAYLSVSMIISPKHKYLVAWEDIPPLHTYLTYGLWAPEKKPKEKVYNKIKNALDVITS